MEPTDLSRIRQSLGRLGGEIISLIEVFTAREPLLRGTLYEMKTKCGKPTCRCAEGEPHKAMVLSWSEEGKKRLKTISGEKLLEVRTLTRRYQRFRKARARLVKIHKQMLGLVDKLEGARRKDF